MPDPEHLSWSDLPTCSRFLAAFEAYTLHASKLACVVQQMQPCYDLILMACVEDDKEPMTQAERQQYEDVAADLLRDLEALMSAPAARRQAA